MTRAEKVAQAQRLRADGLKLREIGERMGVPLKTASAWLSDPDLSKQRARRERYAGRCVDCGNPTDGSGGPSQAPERCLSCNSARRHAAARERHLTAIRLFAERYGRPPGAVDFSPNMARRIGHEWRARRWERDGDYTWTPDVLNVFGSWNAAIEVAGFEPRGVGEYPRLSGTHRGLHLESERAA